MQYDRGVDEGQIAASTRATPENRRRLVFRVAAGLAALVLAGLAIQDARSRAREAREIERLLADTGLARRQPEVAERVRRDSDPVRARLAVARALVAESFDQKIFSRLPQREAIEEASRSAERLELARSLAEQAFPERPAAWQAPMIAGAATYRLWSVRGDPRLVTERAAWEKPLLAAATLAPGEDEPLRLLGWARLEIWPSLSQAERADTKRLLERAFTDLPTFSRLAQLWLAMAGTRAEAHALVPHTPEAWRIVLGIYAGRADWESYVLAHERWAHALRSDLARRLAEVGRRVRGGDDSGARVAALGAVADTPVGADTRDLIEQALTLCPAGEAGSAYVPAFRRWLRWHTDRFMADRPGLSPNVARRLVVGAGELPAAEAALGALSVGDVAAAELWERRTEAIITEPWAPYCIAKARWLARRGDVPGARAVLARANRSWRGTPLELAARIAVAEAARDDGAARAARADLDALAATEWVSTAWRWQGGEPRLDIVAASDAAGLELAVDVAPPRGCVVQVHLDGVSVVTAVAAGPRLTAVAPIAAGYHWVEIEPVAGGRVVPGHARLIAAGADRAPRTSPDTKGFTAPRGTKTGA